MDDQEVEVEFRFTEGGKVQPFVDGKPFSEPMQWVRGEEVVVCSFTEVDGERFYWPIWSGKIP